MDYKLITCVTRINNSNSNVAIMVHITQKEKENQINSKDTTLQAD